MIVLAVCTMASAVRAPYAYSALREKRLRDMRAISERCARLLKPGPSVIEHGDVLYDDRGLPR